MSLRYSLRTLFVLTALVACFLAWWFHPYAVELKRPDGSVQARFELRRDWLGNEIAYGRQTWYSKSGAVFAQKDLYGLVRGKPTDWLDGFDGLIWLITETVEASTELLPET